ncbi:MAG: PAS domain S-box protein [Gemmatimonadota bacterium]
MTEREKIRVLLIDDDEAAHLMTRAILGQIPWADVELDWVSTAAEGAEAIRRRAHDVYLVDYLIGDDSGIELVRSARQDRIRAPMILLTGKGRYEVDVEAMEAGVSDYLDKAKVDPDLMERSIRYSVERVRAETALRESEARHRAMFDHLPIGLYRTTPDGALLDVNPALVQMLGHPDRDTLEFEFARNFFVSPSHRQAFLDRLDQFGVVRGFESELKRPDGRVVPVRNAARAHRDESGATVYLEGAVEDVSDQRESRMLHGRARRFDWIYRDSGLAILLLDLEGKVRGANAAFLDTFGYEEAALLDRRLPALAAEEEAEEVETDIRSLATESAVVAQGQRRFRDAGGELVWARTRMGLVRNPEGHPDHLMTLFEDVAEA